MGYMVITDIPQLANQFKGTFELPVGEAHDFVDETYTHAISWQPQLIQPPAGAVPQHTDRLSECLAAD